MSHCLCGHCHPCGGRLRTVLDSEEWCDHCNAYQRYPRHGWGIGPASDKDTPSPKVEETKTMPPHIPVAHSVGEQDQPKPRCMIFITTPNGTPCSPCLYEGDDVERALTVFREQSAVLEQAKRAHYPGLPPMILEKMQQQRIEGFIDGKQIRAIDVGEPAFEPQGDAPAPQRPARPALQPG